MRRTERPERPPRGPLRETVRRTVLAIRARRRKSVEEVACSPREAAHPLARNPPDHRRSGLLAYAATIWLWQDPATGIYTAWQQRKLADDYERRVQEYTRTTQQPAVVDSTDWAAQIRRDATRYATSSERGDAIGRIGPRRGVDSLRS